MSMSLQGAPFPVTYRELWLPEAINGTNMPSSSRGNALTLTGAAKRTTADGVRFIRGANSEVSLGVIHDSQANLWVSLRFRLNQTFAATSSTAYLWTKRVDADNRLELYLDTADGMLTLQHREAAVTLFTLKSVAASWTGGTWYNVIFSISATAGARLIANNATAVTNADLSPAPAGGAIIIGDQTVAGAVGISGVITDIIMGTDDLTANEESDLYKGIPPLDAVHIYTSDEGRETTLNDRGSGGNSGTLGAAASWAYGQVRESVLSLDGINDRASMTTGSMRGPFTFIWVGKMKSPYDAINRGNIRIFHMIITSADQFFLDWRAAGGFAQPSMLGRSGGASPQLNGGVGVIPVIDDYWIVMISYTATGLMTGFINGSQAIQAQGAGGSSGATASLYLGTDSTAAEMDVSKVLLAGQIETAMTAKQVLTYSRWLRDIKNLPISI